MNEKQERHLRRKAIRLFLAGLRPQEILERIPRCRTWLFKWKTRFDQWGWAGLQSQSRQPHRIARRYDQRTRRLVLQARQRLVRRKVGLIGPRAIQDELRAARLLRRIPSLPTIKRILHEGGLIGAAQDAASVYFPKPTATAHYVLHAMDWTARYLKGGHKVFAFHTVDLQTRAMQQTISSDKKTATVQQHALTTWQTLGLPDGLQMDNDAAFCGGYKAPRVFGQFVRLCLYVGIEPIFIPVHEPKRNSVVERLNGLWAQTFWQRRQFDSVSAVAHASPEFELWYGQHYQPPILQGQTPAQAQQTAARRCLTAKETTSLPDAVPITAGRVHFIRRVAADGCITLLNETWKVDKRLANQYVWATVVTHEQRLKIYHRRSPEETARLVKAFRYEIHESVVALLLKFRRPHRRRKMFTML